MNPPVETGSTVAGFRLRSLIGESDMALVYLAEEVETGRAVALKLLRPNLANDDRFRRGQVRRALSRYDVRRGIRPARHPAPGGTARATARGRARVTGGRRA